MSSETPEGWVEAPFSALARYDNGRAFKPADWGDQGLPIVRIAQITNPAAETNRYKGTVDDRHLIGDGDLIFSWSATLAVLRWQRGQAVLNQHLFKVTPVAGVDRDWLQFRLEASIPDLADEAHGTTMKHIRKSTLSSQTTFVPPLDEQQRIAEVLRSVEEAIQSVERLADQQLQLWEALVEARVWLPALAEPSKLSPLSKSLSGSDYGVNAPLTDEPVGTPILRMGNLQGGQIDLTTLKWGLIGVEEAKSLQLHDGDILFNRTNSRDLVGKVALVKGEPDYLYASYLVRLSVNRTMADPYFVFAVMNSRRGQAVLKSIATPGASQANINPTNLKKLDLPLPHLSEQVEISDALKSVEDARTATLAELASLRAFQGNLSSQLLSGRVRVSTQLSARQKRSVQPAFKRAVFAAEVVHQLHKAARFGSVKHEKIVYLCELHLSLHEDLDRHAYKEAAGPYDPKARRSVEAIFKQQKWFSSTKPDGNQVVYQPLENFGGHATYFQRYFGDRQAEIQTIIDLLRPMSTQQCEIVATLYAVWNDFLIDSRQVSDAEIVASVLDDWHPSKAQIAEDRWLAALPWMRQNGLIPKGLGEKTRVAAT